MIDHLHQAFNTYFNRTDGKAFFSPSRVNLIGEHIDYNGGFVFPCALSYGTYGVAQLRDDDLVTVFSKSFSNNVYSFSLHDLKKDVGHAWVDYIKGSIEALQKDGFIFHEGIDLYIEGDMPLGAGLSSSASLEMLVIYIFNTFYHLNLSKEKMAQLGQYAENKFVGVNSGIMDQFAVIAGKKDHAILLNTDTLAYELIPINLQHEKLIIANTNKRRGLAESKYNERFSECQEALSIIKKTKHITHLCELNLDDLNDVKDDLSPVVYRRVKHVVTEQQRTMLSTKSLKNGDIQHFADLMTASHQSLRDDYEVTGIELDTLQDELIKAGALGARMTGAGFGGCVVAIIPDHDVEIIKETVIHNYEKKIGYKPTFYEVKITDGTQELSALS